MDIHSFMNNRGLRIIYQLILIIFYYAVLTYSDEVKSTLILKKPVIALESTIITHGMPYPENYETALKVESIARSYGVTPATIAVINGEIKIGLNNVEIHNLAKGLYDNQIKISRRDLPFACSAKYSGGTTVSATMIIAYKAGIKLFATGGIGGVHRGAEETMDISTDLTELGRTPITVFSSGIKSILDIGKSLEYLETQGVSVCTFNKTDEVSDFPSFFSYKSGFKSPYTLKSIDDIANLILSHEKIGLHNGILVAVPIPKEYSLSQVLIEKAIKESIEECTQKKIKGKDVTPFLLQRINKLTSNQSLKSNIALICNNVKLASEVAIKLHQINQKCFQSTDLYNKPVVIGASMVDIILQCKQDNLDFHGKTFLIKQKKVIGGVGRNLADCICRMDCNPIFISCIGKDNLAAQILSSNPNLERRGICIRDDISTSCIYIIIDTQGESRISLCDNEANKYITRDWIKKFLNFISKAPLVIIDSNITIDSMDFIFEKCSNYGIPVWLEPTDSNLANKFLLTEENNRLCLTYCSPNFNELQQMINKLINENLKVNSIDLNLEDIKNFLQINKELIVKLGFHTIFVTLGCKGLVVLTPLNLNDSLPIGPNLKLNQKLTLENMKIFFFPSLIHDPSMIQNSSGAGDCLSGVIIQSIIVRKTLSECVNLGLKGAALSLSSDLPIPVDVKVIKNFSSKL